MASSQVEIVSPSPLGCVLKDHGRRRDRFPDPNKAAMNPQDTFHNKLLKSLVREHLPEFPPGAGQVKDGGIDPWFVEEPRNDPGGDTFEREGECSALSPTQARIVDWWAAQQARGMVSTIEKHVQEADLLSKTNLLEPGASASVSLGDTSPMLSSENLNKGAFSLVQMWEARLSKPSGNNNTLGCCSRSNSSVLSCPENVMNSPREDALSYVEGARQTNEDLLTGWESDGAGTAKDPSPSFKGRASSASDSERGRVANIIRRLTSAGDANDNDASPAAESPYREREHTPHHDHAVVDQRLLLHATSSPRIRGRKAFSDLLMQMERDKHKELVTLSDRCAVSKFSQKGRIQAHLKLKLLQRGLAACEGHPLNLFRGPGRGSAPNSPSILPLREMIKAPEEQNLKEHNRLPDLGVSPQHIMSNVSQMATTSMSDQPSKEIDDEVCRSLQPDSEGAPPSMESTTSKYDDDLGTRVSASAVEILSYEDPSLECQQSMDECSSSAFWYEDEQEADEELPTAESNYDWISKVSRPKSYWEDRRQSWYQEMLEQDSGNKDILQLLQRRRVSTFLCSDFRDRMDDLMVSHFRKQNDLLALPENAQIHLEIPMLVSTLAHGCSASQQQQDDDGEPVRERERNQLQMEESGPQGIGEVIDGDSNEAGQAELLAEEAVEMVVEGDERSIIGEQYHEASDHSHHSALSSRSSCSFESLTRSWGFEDHDQAACLSSAQSPRSCAYYMDPLQHTSIDHLSLEIELINELRGQMKQLRREMSELRRLIKICIDFQATMQYSMNQEISSSERNDGMSMKKLLRKSRCCICYEKPRDSLLNRCGHMCTCLKCAIKLQFDSGKCPTCRAPIEDVVRPYPES